jgi:hypothetical protein
VILEIHFRIRGRAALPRGHNIKDLQQQVPTLSEISFENCSSITIGGTRRPREDQTKHDTIDRPFPYVDYYPTVPGFQLLPPTDIDGNLRVVDGNGDGTATVDMGAHEGQGT